MASGHGLSSDDHDDADVDVDPTAGWPGLQCAGYGSRGCTASHSRAGRWAPLLAHDAVIVAVVHVAIHWMATLHRRNAVPARFRTGDPTVAVVIVLLQRSRAAGSWGLTCLGTLSAATSAAGLTHDAIAIAVSHVEIGGMVTMHRGNAVLAPFAVDPSGDEFEPHDRAGEVVGTDREVQLAVGDRQAEGNASLKARDQRVHEDTVDSVQLQRLGAVDALTCELSQELRRVLVGIHHHALGCFRCLVKPRRVRNPDIDPCRDLSSEIANGDSWFVWIRHTTGELDARGELQQVRQEPSHQILVGLRRVLRDTQRERLVHAAVGVGELDVEVVDG
uniref:Uncharacterized protein n=1 Tax=uncultured gamma proteobacterium HF4000_48E10 TaxID=723583 RepID=E7C8T8_9GAMM|nr:hypothetical protein [uncultured gamma proteobacterium HF4000_48E10]